MCRCHASATQSGRRPPPADDRVLTTVIPPSGTLFGEVVLLGQHMHDIYAEAVDVTDVCVMSRTTSTGYCWPTPGRRPDRRDPRPPPG